MNLNIECNWSLEDARKRIEVDIPRSEYSLFEKKINWIRKYQSKIQLHLKINENDDHA